MGVADLSLAEPARFRAFVSYSHADKAAALRLHRKLETYRLPKHLREEQSTGRLGAIFRDREDLPAAEDLTESVKSALAQSAALVVLCSPEAKASPWVAREIALFGELHPDRPVLAALLRGEPAESFPEVLREGREPLAADLRKEGDGARLGFLKIVAGIAGVPLDALVQRDAQRRMRRVMVVTAGALAAMLVMAVMTTIALQARNEAQYQQTEAEGLVEFMLTDLRTDLKGVGRLDVMDAVNARAMEYYDDQGDIAGLPAESLERRARILHAMGEDLTSRDMLTRAGERFAEAHRVTSELLSRDPNNPDRIYGHAQSEHWLGYVAYLEQRWPAAEERFGSYRTLAERLVEREPGNVEWLREAGYAAGNLCSLALNRKDVKRDPLPVCRQALQKVEAVAEKEGGSTKSLSDLANRHGWMSDAYRKSGDMQRAIASLRESHTIVVDLFRRDPANRMIADQLVRAKMTLSEALAGQGDQAEARILNAEARAIADYNVTVDPDNAKWRRWLERLEAAN